MIIAIISSMRFQKEIIEETKRLSLEGNIVLCPVTCSPEEGIEHHDLLLDLHKEKLSICDKAYVLNVGGYIGDDGEQEILFCRRHGIPIEYMTCIKEIPVSRAKNDLYMPFGMDKGHPILTTMYKGTNPIEAKGCFDYLTHKKEKDEPMPLMGTEYKVRVLDVMAKQEENILEHYVDY